MIHILNLTEIYQNFAILIQILKKVEISLNNKKNYKCLYYTIMYFNQDFKNTPNKTILLNK